jgi:hypothetical protein
MVLVLAAALGGLAPAAVAAPPKLESIVRQGAAGKNGDTLLVTGKWSGWPVTLAADSPGVRFEPLPAKGQFAVQVAEGAEPGMCLVRLLDDSGASNPLPFVVSTTPEAAEAEPNDDLAHAGPISLPAVTINGRLQKPGDVDVFAVPLKRGQTLVAALVAHEVLGSPLDAVLQIVDSAGFVAAQNHDARGLDPQLVFAAPRDGTYAVRLFAFADVPNGSISLSGGGAKAFYRLTLSTAGFVDHAFPLAVRSGKSSSVKLLGWNIPDKQSVRSISPKLAGRDVYVGAAGLAGDATIAVVDHPAIIEQEAGKSAAAQKVDLPITVSGRIDPPGDVDTYRITARKGQRLVVRLLSRSLNFPLDGVLNLRGSQGRQLLRIDDVKDGRDPVLSYVVTRDGEFDVAVSDLIEAGGPRYAYRLDMEFEAPDFRLTASSAAFDLPAAKSVVVPLSIERLAGFQGLVELAAQDLPPGMTVAGLDKPAKDSKTARLEFRAAADAKSGAVTIVGRAAGGGPTRLATAPAGFGDLKTTRLWLTIVPGTK